MTYTITQVYLDFDIMMFVMLKNMIRQIRIYFGTCVCYVTLEMRHRVKYFSTKCQCFKEKLDFTLISG